MTVPPSVGPLPGQIKFPQGQWIPNVDQITESGAGILALMDAALNQYKLDQDFERQLYTHGESPPVVRTESATGQLIVVFTGLELGDAGRKKFTYQDGAIGSFAHMTGAFTTQAWTPWPTPEGGIAPSLPYSIELMEATALLNRVGWILFSAFRALSLDGIRINPPITPITQDGIMVGPMKPLAPSGGMAGWTCDLQLQYS